MDVFLLLCSNQLQGEFICRISLFITPSECVYVLTSVIACTAAQMGHNGGKWKNIYCNIERAKTKKSFYQHCIFKNCPNMFLGMVYCKVLICIYLELEHKAGMIPSLLSNIEISCCFAVLHHLTPCSYMSNSLDLLCVSAALSQLLSTFPTCFSQR